MILMQENKKTNKKTIIFKSPEVKALCDALIQAQSKKTGIAIMRLIENALIKEFGFKVPIIIDKNNAEEALKISEDIEKCIKLKAKIEKDKLEYEVTLKNINKEFNIYK